MRAASSLIAIALLPSCNWDFTNAESPVQLLGNPPSLTSFDKLNTLPSTAAQLTEGPDGAPWTAFCEFRRSASEVAIGGRPCTRVHQVRLADPAADEVLEADNVMLRYYSSFLIHEDATAKTRTITLHRPGDTPADEVSFPVTFGNYILRANDGGADDVFLYFLLDAKTTHYDIYRRDGLYHRVLPVPAGVDPAQPQKTMAFLFTADGNTLVVRDADGKVTAYSTLDESQVALGARPPTLYVDDDDDGLLTVGDDGLRVVPLAGGSDHVLTTDAIDASTLRGDGNGNLWYVDNGNLYRGSLDGSAPGVLVQPDAARLLFLGSNGEIIYSRDPGDRYVSGAGDGWLGDWNFMERGLRLRFNLPHTHLHFLEHAARLGIVGDLTSVALPPAPDGGIGTGPGGPPVVLGLNVHDFHELPDGRILSVENHAYAGTWNRLVVIDETTLTAHWVVPAADQLFLVPGGKEMIVDVISGASGYDILRVPIP
jgi:hypothetical protein